jgi:hypothetical protein
LAGRDPWLTWGGKTWSAFGGLAAARRLAPRRYQVTLLDERNFHLFQPFLYQVATGSLAASDIATPLRMIVGQRGVRVLQERAVDVPPRPGAWCWEKGEPSPMTTWSSPPE